MTTTPATITTPNSEPTPVSESDLIASERHELLTSTLRDRLNGDLMDAKQPHAQDLAFWLTVTAYARDLRRTIANPHDRATFSRVSPWHYLAMETPHTFACIDAEARRQWKQERLLIELSKA